MSQPPFSYQSPSPYPPPTNRPTPVTVLAIIGIVFGGLGVLCLGVGGLFQMVTMSNPAMVQAIHQSMGERIVNAILGVCGFLLSGTLLAASIGSLALKPAARRVMIGWALVDIAFGLARLLISVFLFFPRMAQNPAFQQNPNAPQIQSIARVVGLAFMILLWLISTTYAVLVFIFFKKADVVAAFEGTMQNPNAVVPLPPM